MEVLKPFSRSQCCNTRNNKSENKSLPPKKILNLPTLKEKLQKYLENNNENISFQNQ